jgi:hypothetical protein
MPLNFGAWAVLRGSFHTAGPRTHLIYPVKIFLDFMERHPQGKSRLDCFRPLQKAARMFQ